jgi:hypothetical protein
MAQLFAVLGWVPDCSVKAHLGEKKQKTIDHRKIMHKIDAADSGILYELEGQDRAKVVFGSRCR